MLACYNISIFYVEFEVEKSETLAFIAKTTNLVPRVLALAISKRKEALGTRLQQHCVYILKRYVSKCNGPGIYQYNTFFFEARISFKMNLTVRHEVFILDLRLWCTDLKEIDKLCSCVKRRG